MAVIREDVVSIGFDVEQNPFAGLTAGINGIKEKLGVLGEAKSDLRGVAREAGVAGTEVESLADSVHAPPVSEMAKPLADVGTAAGVAKGEVDALKVGMSDVGKQKLTDGVDKLKSGLKHPVSGFKNLLGQAKKLAKEKLDAGVKELPPPLQLGIRVGEKLLGGMKKIADLGFEKAKSGMKGLAEYAKSAAKSLGGKALGGLKAVGKGVAVGIGAAGAALGAGAVAAFKFGGAYETASAKTSTLVDKSKVDMQELSSDLLQLSTDTGEDAAGLQEATYQALSAGVEQDAGAISDFMNVAVKAAKGGFTDATTAVDGLTSTLNAYGMETSEAEGLANQFLITQNKGKTTFGELASSIGGVAPTAKAAGVGVDQLMAGVSSLTANGVGTSEAMTGIKSALSNIIKPSAEATKTAKKLGINFSTAELQSKGFVGFLDEIKTATGGDTDKMAQLFGSVEALNTVMSLTSDEGSALMNDTLNEMATNTTALDDAYNTMADTTEESVKRGLNSFKNLGIEVFKENEGPVKDLTGLFAGAGQELYRAFQSGGFDGLSGQMGSTLSNVLVTLAGYLPHLVQSGSSIIRSLISGIMQNREQIMNSVMQGLTNMAMGVLQMAPDVLALGGMLLMSLVQGLDQQLPNLIPVALAAIQNLCNGLIQNGPAIIQSGINIIMKLINGLIAAAPTILTMGIQLVIMLAQGLVAAVPQLIQTIPQLISAIITTLMSVNWLKLGLDIIKGIGSGIVQGIKGLFGKGKDAGKEVGGGVAAGVNESNSQLTAAADNSTAVAVDSFKPDVAQLSDYGVQMPTAVASGIQEGSTAVETAASGLGCSASDTLNAALAGTVDGAQPTFAQLSTSFDGTMTDMNLSAGMQTEQMDTTVQSAFTGMVGDAQGFSGDLKEKIDQTNLYQSGVSIMQGLDNGLNSMRPAIIATAKGIAADVKNTVNGSLDIHSPSGVLEESGEYSDLGLVKGLKNLAGKVARTAKGVGDQVAFHMSPTQSRYNPESAVAAASTSNSQTNSYNPVFNLTLNGASATDSNERKVKRWVREAMKEAMDGMGRTNPRLREV